MVDTLTLFQSVGMGDYDHHKTIYPPHPRISDFPTTPKDHMFRILEREKQATAEGSGDVESSNEIPYELAQFEIHLRQPVKIHNIRKRMQLEQQASSSENGKRYFYYYKRIFFTPFLKTISVIDLFLQNYVPILYG